MRKLIPAVACAAALLLSVAAQAAGQVHNVRMEGIKVIPQRLEVSVGDTVVWTNKDLVPHTVTSTKAGIESGTIEPNGQFKLVVRKKGEIDYTCRFHPTMHGVLIVK